jgi:succinate dehydrogenase / fumarate reductase, cytochrome b subunit
MRSTRVTVPASHASPPARGALARRVFSLSGLVPLGAFLVMHVVVNARAVRGVEAFDAAVGAMHRIPALRVVEIVLVVAPLVLHAVIGLWLVATRTSLTDPTPYPRPMTLTLRATGVVALAFLALHLPEMRVLAPGPRPHGQELLTILAADLSSTWHGVPLAGVLYLVGAGAVTLHFVAGAWGFFARLPRGADPVMRRWVAWAAGALGVTLFAFFADAVVLHATGSRLFGSRAPAPPSHEPCPSPDSSAR